jgi:hypothetical protein
MNYESCVRKTVLVYHYARNFWLMETKRQDPFPLTSFIGIQVGIRSPQKQLIPPPQRQLIPPPLYRFIRVCSTFNL